jgi:predicted DsbA family dithiol-disulfide isomerase
MGISGVPTFIFENKYLVSGAQDAEALAQVMDKVAEAIAEKEDSEEDGDEAEA